jgi:hypothetical protein
MNEVQAFKKVSGTVNHAQRPESFLNSLPQSVLLIDSASWEIQLGIRALDFTTTRNQSW